MMKTLTLRQIIQAIHDHPLPKGEREFFIYNNFKNEQGVRIPHIVAADAIGNAAIALNVDANELYEALVFIDEEDFPSIVGDEISRWNDHPANYPLEQIADMASVEFVGYLDTEYQLRDWITYTKTEHGYLREPNAY